MKKTFLSSLAGIVLMFNCDAQAENNLIQTTSVQSAQTAQLNQNTNETNPYPKLTVENEPLIQVNEFEYREK